MHLDTPEEHSIHDEEDQYQEPTEDHAWYEDYRDSLENAQKLPKITSTPVISTNID